MERVLTDLQKAVPCTQVNYGCGMAYTLDDINRLKGNMTLLMWAGWYGHHLVVRDLLRMGADPLIQNASGSTVFDICKNETVQEELQWWKRKQQVYTFLICWYRGDPLLPFHVVQEICQYVLCS
jgi:hypothetical protein